MVKVNKIISDSDFQYAQYEIVKRFGSLDYMSSTSPVGEWLNCTAAYKWSIGSKVSATGRWKATDNSIIKVYRIAIDNLHEAVCSTPYYDTQRFRVIMMTLLKRFSLDRF